MSNKNAFRCGLLLALAVMATARADETFNPAALINEADMVERREEILSMQSRKWDVILQPVSRDAEMLHQAMEHHGPQGSINLLGSRPPLVAVESNPVNIQVCTMYAQKRARLFRHYRALVDLTDMGDRRLIKQLAAWLYQCAKSEGVDFVLVWCDDMLSEQSEAQTRSVIFKAVTMVVEMLEEDENDMFLVDELKEYLRCA